MTSMAATVPTRFGSPVASDAPIAAPLRHGDSLSTLSDEEADVLQHLQATSYDATQEKFGWSRGRIYNLACRAGARKTEARIQERAAARKQRQREYLAEVINSTTKADVLDFLDGLPDESVQLHATSIPYNVGKPYGGSPGADNYRFHRYLGWLLMVLSEMERTLAPGGVLFLQVGSTLNPHTGKPYPLDILLYPYLQEMQLSYQNRVVWETPHGLTPKRRLAERSETALIFSKGEPAVFHPTPVRTPTLQPNKRAFRGPRKGQISSHWAGSWPSNVWRIPNVGNDHPERTGHPAQFPEEIVRRAVMLYTLPGTHLVVDAFVGSGTTAAVCKKTGRPFSGCDLFYEDMRAERLASVTPELVSMLPGVTDQSVAVWAAEARPCHVPVPHVDNQLLLPNL
ncbi:DNA-methyltransferase [Sinimarinibacterium sp. CAU 1509]|uniref:DNA-methyltransferase n=1 Tax=Sinimarinibacterium sp. CAU 1509 TaxID=2562283 RepID=UPI00146AF75C|nr:site-specific DNA-methyltransferase [Sinimarinibacterium sp. CAU 1509]